MTQDAYQTIFKILIILWMCGTIIMAVAIADLVKKCKDLKSFINGVDSDCDRRFNKLWAHLQRVFKEAAREETERRN